MKKRFDFKKSLGQNFLKDNNIIEKIIEAIDPSSDLIIEIGPGSGALTKKLSQKKIKTFCFEIDERLKESLSQYENDDLKVEYGDFLNINLHNYIEKFNKITYIGNLPYYITTAIINKIASEGNPHEIIIMIQKEVAERFMSNPSSKSYSSISVFLQYNFAIEKICNVSKNCFIPQPKVDSIVLKLTKHDKYKVNNEEHFYKLVRDSFAHKRKNLKNNLFNYDLKKIAEILEKSNKNLSSRAEELNISEFINISNGLN